MPDFQDFGYTLYIIFDVILHYQVFTPTRCEILKSQIYTLYQKITRASVNWSAVVIFLHICAHFWHFLIVLLMMSTPISKPLPPVRSVGMPKQTAFKTIPRTPPVAYKSPASLVPAKARSVNRPAPRRVLDLVSDDEDGMGHQHKKRAAPEHDEPFPEEMRNVDRQVVKTTGGKSCDGGCGATDVSMYVPTLDYCRCELHLCLECFAKMRYGPGVKCAACGTSLDSEHLLADHRAVKEMLGKARRHPLSADTHNLLLHCRAWVDNGFHWWGGAMDLRPGSPGSLLYNYALCFDDDERLWVADHAKKAWFEVDREQSLLMQHISPNCRVKIGSLQPRWE